jgi:hypothetical protein
VNFAGRSKEAANLEPCLRSLSADTICFMLNDPICAPNGLDVGHRKKVYASKDHALFRAKEHTSQKNRYGVLRQMRFLHS